ncbi:MAG: type II toxin-antitoxin system VapC family toxin [bacterium]|nr:type II toxin-antitoxin system VapC family toxin [bacterium]
MNLVDSCGWLEFFAEGPNAECFVEPLLKPEDLLVPSITLFEVFKVVLRQRGEDAALQAVAAMRQGRVMDLTEVISIFAAKLSSDLKLPMADSIIYATGQLEGAVIWTQDDHFAKLSGVRYFLAK